MKALILDNKVVDIVETEFEVSKSFTFMDCSSDCKAGWSKINGVLTAPPDLPDKTYAEKRMSEYPDMGTQLNKIYDDGLAKWKSEMVDPIKAKYPKP